MNMDKPHPDLGDQTDNGQKKKVVVSREDRLHSENLHLRVLNVAHETVKLQQALEEKRATLTELQQKILSLKSDLEEKYGINLDTHEIDDSTGEVKPKGTSGGSMNQRLAGIG